MSTPASSNILVRAFLGDDGSTPRAEPLNGSPDVIPAGTTPVSNPVAHFLNNWHTNPAPKVEAEASNFIYVRAQSLQDDSTQQDVYLYFARNSQLNNPSSWSIQQIKTQHGNKYNTLSFQGESDREVTADPFVWLAPDPVPGDPYNLIAILVDHGQLPDFSDVGSDWDDFVSNNVNVGFNQVTINKPAPPVTPPQAWSTTFAYTQGDTERALNFNVVCNNLLNSAVAFSAKQTSSGDQPSTPILLATTQVNSSTGFSAGITSTVPAGYTGNLTFTLYSAGGSMPTGSSVVFTVSYTEGGGGGPVRQITVAEVKTSN